LLILSTRSKAYNVMKDKYRIVGPLYNFLGRYYGGESLERCRLAMLNARNIRPGDRLLFAGVGYGQDAIHAAELGADVTVVDASEPMLGKFEQTRQHLAPDAAIRQVHADVRNLDEYGCYDLVVANFFLNVFKEGEMVRVMRHLLGLAGSSGRLVVGDFSPPTGSLPARACQVTYWYTAILAFCLLANNPLHQVYNYAGHLRKMGLEIQHERHFYLGCMDCYWSIMATKTGREQLGSSEVGEAHESWTLLAGGVPRPL